VYLQRRVSGNHIYTLVDGVQCSLLKFMDFGFIPYSRAAFPMIIYGFVLAGDISLESIPIYEIMIFCREYMHMQSRDVGRRNNKTQRLGKNLL
jgi:hypothetical protein